MHNSACHHSIRKLDLELYFCFKELRFLEPGKSNLKINKTNKQTKHAHTKKPPPKYTTTNFACCWKNCRAINLRIFKDNMEIYFKEAQGKN